MYDSSYTHSRVNSYSYKIASAIIEDCKEQGLETINIQDGPENAENIFVYDYETEDTIAIIVSIDDDGDVLYDDDDEVVIVGKFKNGTPLIF